jgi:hypothetical protein
MLVSKGVMASVLLVNPSAPDVRSVARDELAAVLLAREVEARKGVGERTAAGRDFAAGRSDRA